MKEINAIGPDAYMDPELYPTPTNEQNIAWAITIQDGIVAQSKLTEWSQNQDIKFDALELQELENRKELGELTRSEMWQANLRLVDFFIGDERYKGLPHFRSTVLLQNYITDCLKLFPSIDMEDVKQAARIGLYNATRLYEPSRSTSFSTTVYFNIRRALQTLFIEKGRLIKISHDTSQDESRLSSKFTMALITKLEGGFSARLLNLKEDPRFVRTETQSFGSKPDLLKLTNTDAVVSDAIEQESVEFRALKPWIKQLLGKLSTRHQVILELYYGIVPDGPLTLQQIADKLKISRQAVNQAQKRALQILATEVDDRLEL